MTKLSINHALDAQGFTTHIHAAHSNYSLRWLGMNDPDYALFDPRDKGVRRLPMVQVAMERYRRDQERRKAQEAG